MSKYYFLFILLGMFSCFFNKKKYPLEGLYMNLNEKGAVHYVLIKDTSYVHYYKGKFGTFYQEEFLTKIYENKSPMIIFSSWAFYGDIDPVFISNNNKIWLSAFVKNGEIFIDYDLRKQMNFYRVDKMPKNLPVK